MFCMIRVSITVKIRNMHTLNCRFLKVNESTMAGVSLDGYPFYEASHPSVILQGLLDLKTKDMFTDVTICVDKEEFPCHRVLLASCSSYFKAMFYHTFRESSDHKVNLSHVDAASFALILDFIYTSRIYITNDNVQSLLETANLVQVLAVKDACAAYLERQIEVTNCLGIQQFAELHDCMSLKNKAESFAMENFSDVSQEEEVLSLSNDSLKHYISSRQLQVRKEEDVYEICLAWIKHDKKSRLQFTHEIMDCVRFAFLPDEYMKKFVENEDILKEGDVLSTLMTERQKCKAMIGTKKTISVPQCQSRVYSEVVVILGGDDAGMGNETQVQSYNPITKKWKHLEDIPISRDRVATAVSIANNIIVLSRRGSSLMYDSSDNTWSQIAQPLLKERWSHRSVALDGYVYILGGKDVDWSTINSVERFDFFGKSEKWKEVCPMPFAVRNPAATACMGKIYVIGGYSELDPPPAQCYSPLQDKWTMVSPCPLSPQQPACCAVTLRGHIYVICDGSGDVYCYDPMTDTWEKKASLVIGRTDPGVTVCNGTIYVFGGYRESYGIVETMEVYDTMEDHWSPVGYMPSAVYRHGCTTIRKIVK
ncbi:kelch-like protein 24 [Glandiceps talaboti]